MASKSVFPRSSSVKHRKNKAAFVPADSRNASNSLAYSHSSEHELAQLAVTGTFASGAYVTSSDQLKRIKELSDKVSVTFLAKLALYSRQKGNMKDMPAALAVILSMRDPSMLDRVFDRVIDNGRMVRNFVQMVRSGAFGRTSLGSGPKRLIKRWFKNRSGSALFRDSIGNSPSIADVIKLVHPRPESDEKRALYGYLLGREYSEENLPGVVRHYLNFKNGHSDHVPEVDFRQLTSLPLKTKHWAQIATNGRWHQTRMNLNTYSRHGVFDVHGMTETIAAKIRDPESIRKARVFPYQLMVAYQNVARFDIPTEIQEALQDAMEVAIENIPEVDGRIIVCPDLSGSMSASVTGYRGSATSSVRCRDAAALIASAFLRKNPNTLVLPFHDRAVQVNLNSRDSVMTNAEKLRNAGSGGTNCSAPISWLNHHGTKGDLIVMVSDNESWLDSSGRHTTRWGRKGTTTFDEFVKFQKRNPGSKMVCLDLHPGTTSQAPDAPGSVMNIGGFSDDVFGVIERFYRGDHNDSSDVWVKEINSISI